MDATNSSTVSVHYEWGAHNRCDSKWHCVDTVIHRECSDDADLEWSVVV